MRNDETKSGARKNNVKSDADGTIELLAKPQMLELSDRDMDALLDAIANPLPPNDAMVRAMERWRKHVAPQ